MDNSFLESLKEILEPYDDIESNKDGFVVWWIYRLA